MKYTVKPEENGRKVRDILRGSMGVSYTALKSAKWNGRIFLNRETVEIEWAEDTPVYALKPFDMPVEVPWEDEHLLIAVKPAGVASQSSRNHPDDSLENAVYARLGCPENFIYRPVNRLDKGTGGLMAIARTPHAQHLLQKQLHTPAFRRRYLAWTDGRPAADRGVLDFPIAKAPGATVKRIVSGEGKQSRTKYRVLREQGNGALVLLELETGRTHQIRLHLAALGHPLVGDRLYGGGGEFPRPALHSAFLSMLHPVTGERLELYAPLPEDMAALLESLGDGRTAT